MTNPIRVLIVDDHPMMRYGLGLLINGQPDLNVVGEAEDGLAAVAQAASLKPDVILLDLAMPQMDGLEAIRAIKTEQPDARILVLTSFAGDDKVFPAIKAGALGYLLKDVPPAKVLQAIRDVYHGELSLHPAIARKVIKELNQPTDTAPAKGPLTDREVAVLMCLARGLTNRQIAQELTITEHTVNAYTSSILKKLHLANRTQAALYALQHKSPSDQDPPA
jgi:two-component system, NarL family, response regulator LiaR